MGVYWVDQMPQNLQNYLNFALDTAHQAGRLTLGYFQRDIGVEMKDDQTPVTIADREAEALIRSRIESTYPGHAILGEEGYQG
jgi:myo-inositol-1(or 4)-monophosphatase